MSCRTEPCSFLVMDGRPDELPTIDYSSDVANSSLFGHVCPAEGIYSANGGSEFTCSCIVPSSNVCNNVIIFQDLVFSETCDGIFKINMESNSLTWKCNLMSIKKQILSKELENVSSYVWISLKWTAYIFLSWRRWEVTLLIWLESCICVHYQRSGINPFKILLVFALNMWVSKINNSNFVNFLKKWCKVNCTQCLFLQNIYKLLTVSAWHVGAHPISLHVFL